MAYEARLFAIANFIPFQACVTYSVTHLHVIIYLTITDTDKSISMLHVINLVWSK